MASGCSPRSRRRPRPATCGAFSRAATDALAAVDALDEVFALSSATSAGAHLRFDVSLARGLSYYTGAIMEITVPDLAGSLGGGGRYDGLIGMFLGENIPACGFSLASSASSW